MIRDIGLVRVTLPHRMEVEYYVGEVLYILEVCVGNLTFDRTVLSQSCFVIFLDVAMLPHLGFFPFDRFINPVNFIFVVCLLG